VKTVHKVVINKLGPIKYADLECDEFMVFTGTQASGKSTIAKVVFFFRTIKDDILTLMIKKISGASQGKEPSLLAALNTELKDKFMRVFGSSWGMDNEMYIEYHFSNDTYIKVALKEEPTYSAKNLIYVEYSDNIVQYLKRCNRELPKLSLQDDDKALLKEELNKLFSDFYESIYIPAGRSMITLLATQLNYIYSTMEDTQKKAIDYCTRHYLERILRIRPEFDKGLQGLIDDNFLKARRHDQTLPIAQSLITEILRGYYKYNNGDERLEIPGDHYVKINFMSSGQQEVVWVLNLFFYPLLQGKPTYFIIEEPESHLFPASQKAVSEFISFVKNAGNTMLVTTHSPYVLGSFNNLLYADSLTKDARREAEEVIPKHFWIKSDAFDAWFVKDGIILNCMDSELNIINNEIIDGISSVINDTYDKLFELRMKSEGAGE
jgi:predicted ATP-dependent endonuclease of OLD family